MSIYSVLVCDLIKTDNKYAIQTSSQLTDWVSLAKWLSVI